MGLGGLSVSWYLPIMQPFLEAEFHLDALEIGGLLMLDGATFALATPFWGWALDSDLLSPPQSLFVGSVCITIGYSFLGLASYKTSMIGIGMAIKGLGEASCILTTYMIMLSSSTKSGFVEDTEQTQGILTSIWYCFYSLGGYLGSTCGGWAYDVMGFRDSTFVIIGTQVFGMLSLSVMWIVEYKQRKENNQERGYHLVPDNETQ